MWLDSEVFANRDTGSIWGTEMGQFSVVQCVARGRGSRNVNNMARCRFSIFQLRLNTVSWVLYDHRFESQISSLHASQFFFAKHADLFSPIDVE